jgi:hypothetical protein
MDEPILRALQEWSCLESRFHRARRDDSESGQAQVELVEKETELLGMRAHTNDGALLHLSFCATFIEQNCSDRSILAMGAIRHAINVLRRSQVA